MMITILKGQAIANDDSHRVFQTTTDTHQAHHTSYILKEFPMIAMSPSALACQWSAITRSYS